MRKQDPDMRFPGLHEFGLLAEYGAVHVEVAAGFEHEAFPEVVVVGFCLGAFFEEGWAGEGGEAGDDDAGWFAGCVHVYCCYWC